jgi:integrase
MSRRRLAKYGPWGKRVQVFQDGDKIGVRWREEGGAQRKKSWPNTPAGRSEAKAWAKGFSETRNGVTEVAVPATTTREVWEKFVRSHFKHLRRRTQELYTEYFTHWMSFVGPHFVCEKATLDTVDTFREAMTEQGYSVNTIQHAISTVKLVYRWGQGRELIAVNRLSLYRFQTAKEQRTESPEEYRREEFQAILKQLSPWNGGQWRAFVALGIIANQGVRQNAALHLRWEDIDLDRGDDGMITWRSEWDKMGNQWEQPLRKQTKQMLEIAQHWHEEMGITSEWVIPASRLDNKQPVYSQQSLWKALKKAENAAGVKRLDGRGAHGFRRMLAGNVWEEMGDAKLAMEAIGDKDLRQMQRYLKNRPERLAEAFKRLDAKEPTPLLQNTRKEPYRNRRRKIS